MKTNPATRVKAKSWKTYGTLGQIDRRNIFRDPLLKWFVIFPVLITVVVRFGVPRLREMLLDWNAIDIADYYLLFLGFMLIIMPLLVGMVIGFLLIDQKEDGTFAALQVTPVPPNVLLTYRLAIPLLISTLVTPAMLILMDLEKLDVPTTILASIAAAPMAPLFALVLGGFAKNKVQGFAISKVNGILTLPPIVAYFVPEPAQWICGLAPTFWPVKAFWLTTSDTDLFVFCLVTGMAYFAVVIYWLAVRWNRIIRS